jgi:ubiquinone/menaquinone biosynthesis C-methylase UbiE
MSLSYQDSLFDLVITSDSLEHVPDVDKALREIYRVLKPGGYHIFTVPIVWDRPETRKCAEVIKDRVVQHAPPSYHGLPGKQMPDLLVFHEFGADFPERCRQAGFQVNVMKHDDNPASAALVTKRALQPQSIQENHTASF